MSMPGPNVYRQWQADQHRRTEWVACARFYRDEARRTRRWFPTKPHIHAYYFGVARDMLSLARMSRGQS